MRIRIKHLRGNRVLSTILYLLDGKSVLKAVYEEFCIFVILKVVDLYGQPWILSLVVVKGEEEEEAKKGPQRL